LHDSLPGPFSPLHLKTTPAFSAALFRVIRCINSCPAGWAATIFAPVRALFPRARAPSQPRKSRASEAALRLPGSQRNTWPYAYLAERTKSG